MKWIDWLVQAEIALQYLLPLALAVGLSGISLWLIPVGLYVGWQIATPIQVVVNTLFCDALGRDAEEFNSELEEAEGSFWDSWGIFEKGPPAER